MIVMGRLGIRSLTVIPARHLQLMGQRRCPRPRWSERCARDVFPSRFGPARLREGMRGRRWSRRPLRHCAHDRCGRTVWRWWQFGPPRLDGEIDDREEALRVSFVL